MLSALHHPTCCTEAFPSSASIRRSSSIPETPFPKCCSDNPSSRDSRKCSNTLKSHPSPRQTLLRRWTSEASAEVDILLAHSRVRLSGQLLLGGPDFLLGDLLAGVVFCDGLAAEFLEVERALLEARVHFAVDEDAGVDVLLGVLAQVLVFGHDALVDLVDELEVCVAGVLVAEDLVLHGGAHGAVGYEALDHEEVRAGSMG
jgi:hypothetical protein